MMEALRFYVRLRIILLLLAAGLIVALVLGMTMAVPALLGGLRQQNTCGATSVNTGNGQIRWPMRSGTFTISSPYGPRGATGASAAQFHHGVDLAAPLQTPIYAVADGLIEKSGTASGFGDWIVEKSTIGGQTVGFVYGHMYPSGLLAQEGQTVKAGDMIAYVGANGEATGPHLHFEVWPGGRLEGGHDVDPMGWLTGAAGTSPAPTTTAPATKSSGGLAPAPKTTPGPNTLGPAPSSTPAPKSGSVVLTGAFPVQGAQATMSVSAAQRDVVGKIVGVTKGQGLPLRAAVLVTAAAMQESSLTPLDHGDAAGPDSRGILQQRDSWGPLEVRMDPAGATGLFLNRLTAFGWQTMTLADAVQRVQVSADGAAYAKWETQAMTLVAQSAGVDPIAAGVGRACTI